mgnify:CR=1 FL=1
MYFVNTDCQEDPNSYFQSQHWMSGIIQTYLYLIVYSLGEKMFRPIVEEIP